MEFAQHEYYHVFTFDPFFQETLDNLQDKRYLALWKVCGGLAHDPDLLAEADKLFSSDGEAAAPGRSDTPSHAPGPGQITIIRRTSQSLPEDQLENRGRLTMKLFMSLPANPELRKAVFGS